MCEALGVRRSNYYRWLKNQNDKKEQEESARQEIKLVEEIFES
jgi:hypothetical protein